MTNTDPITPGAEPVAVVSRPSDTRLKPRKSKKARESFTLPMLEFLMLKTLKLRSSKLGSPVKKMCWCAPASGRWRPCPMRAFWSRSTPCHPAKISAPRKTDRQRLRQSANDCSKLAKMSRN